MLSKLQKLCRVVVYKGQEWANHPFSVSWSIFSLRNERWIGATKGFCLILIKSLDYPDLPDATEKVKKAITVTGEYVTKKTNLSDLKTFLGVPVWECDKCDEVATCTECNGDADTTCPYCNSSIVCDKCNGSGKEICHFCNDTGYFDTGDPNRIGVINGIYFNRNILAQYLSIVDGDTVEVSTLKKIDPIIIKGPDWVVYFMPLDMRVDNAPVYPEEKLSCLK